MVISVLLPLDMSLVETAIFIAVILSLALWSNDGCLFILKPFVDMLNDSTFVILVLMFISEIHPNNESLIIR